MRHAKSAWKDSSLPDFARPLNNRGRRDAPRMGRLIAEEHGLPDYVLCSSARRAVETYCGVSREWGEWPELCTDAALYACGPQLWLERLSGLPDTVGTVMIVGHMPELYEVLGSLLCDEAMPDRLPTAALAVVEATGGWSALGPESCRLGSFETPRDL